jgi:L-ornithine N5-monooxygenase
MSLLLRGGEGSSESPSNGSLKRKRADTETSRTLETVATGDIHDLICVGFGPASLAIAVALHDALEQANHTSSKPKVCFLEQQPEFRWHAGMMLPDAKMQISFLKDLAIQRNPRSHFTFLNYLKIKNRLTQFTNLGTFLPTRLEFSDYMKWCSSAFADVVEYGSEVVKVDIVKSQADAIKYDLLSVESCKSNGEITTRRTRNLVIAVGGRPQIPTVLPQNHPRVIHSSVYASQISNLLKVRDKAYNIGVIGSGQSAAEVFNDLHSRYPNAHTCMIFRDTALRPSDDSPFVNEIFDDERIAPFFNLPESARSALVAADKSTNYSVVQSELLEKIYHNLYQQNVIESDKSQHKHKLYPSSEVVDLVDVPQNKRVNLILKRLNHIGPRKAGKETLNLDALIYATGYARDTHNKLLEECQVINASNSGQWEVRRDYRAKLDRGFVVDDLNIYLQGCNEASHGLSDSLISVLATRGGEVVESIFGEGLRKTEEMNGDARPAVEGMF